MAYINQLKHLFTIVNVIIEHQGRFAMLQRMRPGILRRETTIPGHPSPSKAANATRQGTSHKSRDALELLPLTRHKPSQVGSPARWLCFPTPEWNCPQG